MAVSIGVTAAPPQSRTYRVRPSGVRASVRGWLPTGMGAAAAPVRTLIGVTVFEPLLAT